MKKDSVVCEEKAQSDSEDHAESRSNHGDERDVVEKNIVLLFDVLVKRYCEEQWEKCNEQRPEHVFVLRLYIGSSKPNSPQ